MIRAGHSSSWDLVITQGTLYFLTCCWQQLQNTSSDHTPLFAATERSCSWWSSATLWMANSVGLRLFSNGKSAASSRAHVSRWSWLLYHYLLSADFWVVFASAQTILLQFLLLSSCGVLLPSAFRPLGNADSSLMYLTAKHSRPNSPPFGIQLSPLSVSSPNFHLLHLSLHLLTWHDMKNVSDDLANFLV